MSAEENKKIFLRFIKELGKGNLAVIDEVCSPNFAFHSPNFPDWPRGLEGARKLVDAGPTIFSNAQTTIDDVFAADDKVVMRMTIRGTYIGEPKHGFPNPGERFAMGGIAIYRFLNSAVSCLWNHSENCSQSARVRAICDRPWTRRASPSAAIRSNRPISLSARFA